MFYTGDVLGGFDGFAGKSPTVGFLFKQSFEKRFRPGCFFRGFCGIFGSTCLVEHKRLLLYCFGTIIIVNILSSICRTKGMQSFSFFLNKKENFLARRGKWRTGNWLIRGGKYLTKNVLCRCHVRAN